MPHLCFFKCAILFEPQLNFIRNILLLFLFSRWGERFEKGLRGRQRLLSVLFSTVLPRTSNYPAHGCALLFVEWMNTWRKLPRPRNWDSNTSLYWFDCLYWLMDSRTQDLTTMFSPLRLLKQKSTDRIASKQKCVSHTSGGRKPKI